MHFSLKYPKACMSLTRLAQKIYKQLANFIVFYGKRKARGTGDKYQGGGADYEVHQYSYNSKLHY